MQPVHQLKGHSKPVYGICQYNEVVGDWSNKCRSRLLLSCSADETIRLWDSEIGSSLARYNSIGGVVWAVSFAQYGYFFASCNQNGTATVFATDRTSPLRSLCGHSADVLCCAWHPNLVSLATGSDDRSVRLWDMRTGNCCRIFRCEASTSVLSVAISPSGESIVAGYDGEYDNVCWDVGSGRVIASLESTDSTYSVSYDESGNIVVAGGSNNSITLWSVNKFLAVREPQVRRQLPEVIPLLQPEYKFHTKKSPVYKVGVSTDGLFYGAGPIV